MLEASPTSPKTEGGGHCGGDRECLDLADLDSTAEVGLAGGEGEVGPPRLGFDESLTWITLFL